MTTKALADLDRATIALGKELFSVKASLDVYALIGLNATHIHTGERFFGQIQNLCLLHVTLGLTKIFEREKPPYELCSISGLYKLAIKVPIQNSSALHPFLKGKGIETSGNWVRDLTAVLTKQRKVFKRHLRRVTLARNTSIAHLQRNVSPQSLPSIAAFRELLSFGVAFHKFINAALLSVGAHPILADRKVADSLAQLLQKSGLETLVRDFPD
jgi:hypothetical protein